MKLPISGYSWLTFLLFMLTLDMYFPGLMTHDSVLQLQDAISGEFHDGSPPIMSLLWRMTNKIRFGPIGMLVFHNVVFWTALSLFGKYIFKTVLHRIYFLIGVGFFPSIFSQLGTIWKDVGLSVTLFLGTIFFLMASEENKKIKKRLLLFGGSLCYFYGLGVRYNAAPSVLILCLWATYKLVKSPSTLYKWILGLCLFLFLLGSNMLLSSLLVKDRKMYPFQTVEVFDLASISIDTNQNMFPNFIKNTVSLEKIKSQFSPDDSGLYFFSGTIPWIRNVDNINELHLFWIDSIKNQFPYYLKHRTRYFKNLLGLDRPKACAPMNLSLDENPFNLHFRSNWIWRGYYDVVRTFQDSFIFRGYTYMILLILVLCFSLLNRRFYFDSLFIAASGLVYALGYYIYGPSCEFRYLYWTVMASMISVTLLLKRRLLVRH